MRGLRRAWNRLAGSLTGGRRDAELAEEFDAHIAMLTDANLRRGMTRPEARRAALLTFGGVEAAKEGYRDQRGLPTLDSLMQDLRYAGRSLRRNPVFTAAVLACLTLGIGANTAIFSLVNAVLLRPLPVDHPERLLFFASSGDGDFSAVRENSSGYGRSSLPYATYETFRDRARTLDGVFVAVSLGFRGNGVTVNLGDRSIAADGEMVTGSYFSVLGVVPVVGRAIGDGDLMPGSPDVAVLGHRFWERELGGDRGVAGRTVALNGRLFTIVGVAPPGFDGLGGQAGPDVWVPLREMPGLTPWGVRPVAGQSLFTDRKYWWCTVGARRKPGVSMSEVVADTGFLFHQSISAGVTPVPSSLPALTVSNVSPAAERLGERLSRPLRILMATAGLVLLIACANVATLLVARAKSRQKEIGVRLAIGAARGRIVRQLLTESLLLSACGGALGLVSAYWTGPALVFVIPGLHQATLLDARPDLAVFGFAAVVSLVTGLLFGLAPALRAARTDLAPQLTEVAASTTPRLVMGRVLVVSQIALSVVLLFGAGLFLRTFQNLDGQTLGFDREDLLLFELDPQRGGYQTGRVNALYVQLLEKIQELPGARSATYSQFVLLSGWSSTSPSATDGQTQPAGQANRAYSNRVGPQFFETMGIRMRLGRGIGWSDAHAGRPVAVVNESWARAFFPNQNPVGHHLSVGRTFDPAKAYEIVGLVEDAKYDRMRNAPPPTVYVAAGAVWDEPRRMSFAVRTSGDPLALTALVRAALREIDPGLPLFNVTTQRRQVDEALGQERMLAQMSGGFGVLALILVALGIYGTLSYGVTQRTGEIGIRLALGAGRIEVVWMILRESLVMTAIGVAVGMPAALALARLITSHLFGVEAADTVTVVATVAILSLIAAVAGFVPANQASRIDPVRALRHG